MVYRALRSGRAKSAAGLSIRLTARGRSYWLERRFLGLSETGDACVSNYPIDSDVRQGQARGWLDENPPLRNAATSQKAWS